MKVLVYDHAFNLNEWFIIIGLVIGVMTIILLPKRFSPLICFVFFIIGVYSGFFFDHSLSVEPVSFYDVNDTSKFEIMDFVSYWMYGPMSYVFFYCYDKLRPNAPGTMAYILCWSLIGVGLEGLAVLCGVFHYLHGYKLYYSFPIYLAVQTCWIGVYYRFKKTGFL